MESPIRLSKSLLAVGLGLLLVYLGAYGVVLKGKIYTLVGTAGPAGRNVFDIRPKYRAGRPAVERFFKPAHRIDRLIRSEYWESIEHSSGRKWKNPAGTPAARP